VQADNDLQNGAAAKRKRKGPSVKERLMRCQRTERERLTFGKVSFVVSSQALNSPEHRGLVSSYHDNRAADDTFKSAQDGQSVLSGDSDIKESL